MSALSAFIRRRGLRHYRWSRVAIALLLSGLLIAAVEAWLDERESNRMVAEARRQLAEFSRAYSDLDGWQKRAEGIRAGILHGAGLLPLPEKQALRPIFHRRREYEGYTVENVAFESLPGFFVTGNLYRPLGKGEARSRAGILSPHGHFERPNGGGRFTYDVQKACATLARMGAVVFSYDMVGWGESEPYPHDRRALALQLWNSLRSVDFLISLEEVDPDRLAVFGASGGGTQAFLLTAIDDRVAVSIPAVMVSAHSLGGCVCESGMPIHKSAVHETNNVEIAALAAPRPMLLISNAQDSTKFTPEMEFPYVKNIYEFYGAGDNVENLHLIDEGHDFGFSKRSGVYSFFAKHLGLSLDVVGRAGTAVDEGAVTIEKQEVMKVFGSHHPRPEHSVSRWQEVEALLEER